MPPTQPALTNKDKSALYAFVERASGRLVGIRNGLLIFDQNRSSDGDIDVSLRGLELLRRDASDNQIEQIVGLIDECETSIRAAIGPSPPASLIGRSLDIIAKIEEFLLTIPLSSDDFLPDVSDFIDDSFRSLWGESPKQEVEPGVEEFEVDEETLEIFRSEATELLSSISHSVESLRSNPDNREALWEVRRCAHTFKGAAGIVGVKDASELAHRVEDLLDLMVENTTRPDTEILELLSRAYHLLDRSTFGTAVSSPGGSHSIYSDFDSVIARVSAMPTGSDSAKADLPADKPKSTVPIIDRPASSPIVRVSLDRLDNLIDLSGEMATNRRSVAVEFSKLIERSDSADLATVIDAIGALLDAQRHLTAELQDKLFGIRLVRFGTLETRLSRAVHVTSEEEQKNVGIVLENGDTEIDTQIIDALIEPLLHLLKNAVVHGIEREDTRRLIGKPEKGLIRIRIDSDSDGLTLTVADDGRGISIAKLKEKAIRNQLICAETAELMNDNDAYQLIFERGLTTADTLNLNAGRGIGMSIVKESVAKCGGQLNIASETQAGTTFTIRMPLTIPRVKAPAVKTPEPANIPKIDEPARKVVLIVDDSPSVRSQTCKVVEECGHRVITAQNGAEALELLLSGVWHPDLILSDVEMPIMDGWELLEYVKTDEHFGKIPVVMITSLAEQHHRDRAMALGASDYQIKPVNRLRLASSIASQIGEHVS
ncbi:MAG TPA: response regulator [Pyrinomonadaceae bacterium]|nr:response regulator [Pyrinomonadaceae bacterium]HQX54922.1 response regulator [Pyrinomonadaceae bacterium]